MADLLIDSIVESAENRLQQLNERLNQIFESVRTDEQSVRVFLLNVASELDSLSHRGLSKESIDGIPQVMVTTEQRNNHIGCTICLEEFRDKEMVKELPCKHNYHGICIENWLLKRNTCPNCRHAIELHTGTNDTAIDEVNASNASGSVLRILQMRSNGELRTVNTAVRRNPLAASARSVLRPQPFSILLTRHNGPSAQEAVRMITVRRTARRQQGTTNSNSAAAFTRITRNSQMGRNPQNGRVRRSTRQRQIDGNVTCRITRSMSRQMQHDQMRGPESN